MPGKRQITIISVVLSFIIIGSLLFSTDVDQSEKQRDFKPILDNGNLNALNRDEIGKYGFQTNQRLEYEVVNDNMESEYDLQDDGFFKKSQKKKKGDSKNNHAHPQLTVSPETQQRLFAHARRAERVFYNRVPKCGSEGVVTLFRYAAKANGFHVNRSHEFRERYLSDSKQLELVRQVQSLAPPAVYDRHVYFTNFSKFHEDMPVYINVIRDPVERFISAFHFNKKGCRSQACREETIEECIGKNTYRCNMDKTTPTKNKMWMTIPFFCGHHIVCRTPSRAALDLAKRHAAQHYLVIGLLEELDVFYYILDHAIPRFFSGIHTTYKRHLKKDKHVKHRTASKPETPQSTRQKLRDSLVLEYEFYDYIRQLVNARLTYAKRLETITDR